MSKISVVSGRQPDDARQNDGSRARAEPCYVWNAGAQTHSPKLQLNLRTAEVWRTSMLWSQNAFVK